MQLLEIYSWILVGMLITVFVVWIGTIIYFNQATRSKIRMWVWDKHGGGGMRKYLVDPDIEGYGDIGDKVPMEGGQGWTNIQYAVDTQVSGISEVYPDFPPWAGRRMPVSLHIRNHTAAISIDDQILNQKNIKDTSVRTKAARDSMVLMTFMKISQRILSKLKESPFSLTNILIMVVGAAVAYDIYLEMKIRDIIVIISQKLGG